MIQRLLIKDPTKRIGGGERDALEIKEHPFFAKHIPNWEDLINKRYTPPYTPTLESADDVRHFDEMFTKMDPFGSYTGAKVAGAE